MDQYTIASRFARKSCSATETKYMYNIVILFTVDQIFVYTLKVSKNVISFESIFGKETRAVIDLVDSFYTYGTDKLNLVGCFDVPSVFAFAFETRGHNDINNGLPMTLKWHLLSSYFYPHAFLKKRRGYCNRLRPSVRPSVTLSPPKPLDEIQPNLVCELLT